MMTHGRAVVALALALVAAPAGCAGADDDAPSPDQGRAADTEAPVAAVAGHPGGDEGSAPALPDLVGAPVDAARAEVAAAGLRPRVVAVDDDAAAEPDTVVTAHHPSAGERATGEVTLWIGTPPDADPPPPPEPSGATGADTDAGAGAAADAESDPRDDAGDAGDATTASADEDPAGSRSASDGPAADPPPDRVNIREVAAAPTGLELSGPASWYGPGFAGRTTACGGRFDPEEPTLATRELRCGTVVRVDGPGGSVEATVTDWGPAEWTNRRFDLARATFAEVASLGAGVVDVTLIVVEP